MMMSHHLTVDAGLEPVIDALLDPAVVCRVPGLRMRGRTAEGLVEGELELTVGGATIQYRGTLVPREANRASGTIGFELSGRELRGRGSLHCAVSGTLRSDGARTTVTLAIDVDAGGRVAKASTEQLAFAVGRLVADLEDVLADHVAGAPSAEASADTAVAAGPSPWVRQELPATTASPPAEAAPPSAPITPGDAAVAEPPPATPARPVFVFEPLAEPAPEQPSPVPGAADEVDAATTPIPWQPDRGELDELATLVAELGAVEDALPEALLPVPPVDPEAASPWPRRSADEIGDLAADPTAVPAEALETPGPVAAADAGLPAAEAPPPPQLERAPATPPPPPGRVHVVTGRPLRAEGLPVGDGAVARAQALMRTRPWVAPTAGLALVALVLVVRRRRRRSLSRRPLPERG